ncbi:adenylate/guanylate cyclase domain-containing response regulator [Arcticibacterium luteifluviistationis]|uniref:Adenylate/guanylate cyclase domain-containing response regulator n=1 Tax=Arcticibacterium luteifluviistationis TaxID=1784714 RepID=A0A2Z4G7B2_9BACT|nr:adenylate/guanylate cyclase domain-containing response regulator [Arcticibacterium luteifluviistationis]AWV96983.1 adenylate/guanylate cyclase domain-containing response regulator [Arcticibacterium luteifluviistationis]
MKTKILVVDDESDLEALIRQKFRRQIRENKYEFFFAENGRKALEVLDSDPEIFLVLSDINMPEMDGLSLLVKISENNPLIQVVMVSAYGDMDNIRSAMNKGAYDFVCKPVNFEDLEVTMEKTIVHIKQIKETVDAIKENNILKMYVDDSVLNFMSKQEFANALTANETIEASVLFVDICGFTAITEKESADFVVNILNTYFDIIVKEIIAHNGYVDKFMGDAVMAVFKGEYHIDRAIDAALALVAQIDSIKTPVKGKEQDYLPKVALGIATGEVISGNIGSSTLKRLDYTVIGDVVNTAARLQAAASDSQILITEIAYLEVKDSFKCEEVGVLELKNKEFPVKCYAVLE